MDWRPGFSSAQLIKGTILLLGISIVLGVSALLYILPKLNQGSQAVVLASVIGTLGTLGIFLARLYHTHEETRNRELERQRPIVIDEIADIIQPAILALEQNLNEIYESENTGCDFDWIYVDESKLRPISSPTPVQYENSLNRAKLQEEHQDLYEQLYRHDETILELATLARELKGEMSPKIEEVLEEDNLEEHIEDDMNVLISAIIQEIPHFGDTHSLYDFWERRGEGLIEYAKSSADPSLKELKQSEEDYKELIQESLRTARRTKTDLRQEYGISERDIPDVEPPGRVV